MSENNQNKFGYKPSLHNYNKISCEFFKKSIIFK